MNLSVIDLVVICVYVLVLAAVALHVSRERTGHEKSTNDYFLAGNSLPWWAIGASLIAANISAEQIIGMSGSGYVIGLGIASYEWMAAITLIIVGKYFLPVFLKQKIYTMPQFLEQRYDHRVRNIMAIFWLGVYVFVNLTSVLWLGALAIETVTGVEPVYGMLFLGAFAAGYSLYGGLKAVALTDIIQVVVLVAGGLLMSYICLDLIGDGRGIFAGFTELTGRLPEKFDMILSPENPHYIDLPGISVLVGGLWVMNISYWGFNQYIVQRILAAKDLREGQRGIAFAAFLKLLMPLIVVLPGIAAVVLMPGLERSDQAYPALIELMPVGIKGLVFAAVVAAIVSSLGSMMNSISTIFTMDLYAFYRRDRVQSHYVAVGRGASLAALLLATVCAGPLLGSFDQAFQYIQEFTGFFTPGIAVMFLLGIFWKRATAVSALVAAVGSAVLSLLFKLLLPEMPFMDRVGWVFALCLGMAVIAALLGSRPGAQVNSVTLGEVDFSTGRDYNLAGTGVALILLGLYVTWW
ncbi:sodium/sugar symporter [Microbulbifer taiwanensis]|uniref:Sodium/sugar symporter n=1 Tax=Microbulbifer taiwanensis TaxID=986746 RepID=A0ABW1YQQ9_9GAMM|nr:sodium/sugar symporter [Microbulbifer taiwanensis]